MRIQGCPLGVFLLFLASCSPGGGGGSETNLVLVSTNIQSGGNRTLNDPLEFRFNKPVNADTLNLSTIQINQLPAVVAGAPEPRAVQGFFYTKSEDTVLFQPLCPTSVNPDWGFTQGNDLGSVSYNIVLPGGSPGQGPLLAGLDGSTLRETLSLQFQIPGTEAMRDPVPGNPPVVANASDLPLLLSPNFFANPLDTFSVRLDQPVLLPDKKAVRLSFVDEETGLPVSIPSLVEVVENCTVEGGAVLTVVPLGILPLGKEISFSLGQIQGLGGESFTEETIFHRARVREKAADVERDVLLETFDHQLRRDSNPGTVYPLATWEDGRLEAAHVFPGSREEFDIEIGPGTTNGEKVFFDTGGATLKDTNGLERYFPDGIIECRNFDMKRAFGKNVQFIGTGPNPLIIRTTGFVKVSTGCRITVNGQDGREAVGINATTSPTPGGSGYCGGGDGGAGSAETMQSTPKGIDGNGSFQAPLGGAKGGHSAYGGTSSTRMRPGGGGGGNWGTVELNDQGKYVRFYYSDNRWCEDAETCRTNKCKGPKGNGNGIVNNSFGEPGANGTRCTEGPGGRCTINGDGVCQLDAITKGCWAQGGATGRPYFVDGDDTNNFLGSKPIFVDGALEVIKGEMTGYAGGQGAGGGGDSVTSRTFPNRLFRRQDHRGGGGGGGAGIIVIQSLGKILVDGIIEASGGTGGEAEHLGSNRLSGGGGGGGAGGMIILETADQIKFTAQYRVSAFGGNRGKGAGTLPGSTIDGGEDCIKNETSSRGGAGGKGVIIFRIPFNPDKQVSCGGVIQPALREGEFPRDAGIFIVHSNGTRTEVLCERDLTPAGSLDAPLYTRFDPAPHILNPTFGDTSVGQSSWTFLGWPTLDGTHEMAFGGTELVAGEVDPAFEEVFLSGSGVSAIGENFLTVTSPDLAAYVGLEPNILAGDAFRADVLSTPITIQSAEAQGEQVTLYFEEYPGGDPGNWTLSRRFFRSLLNRVPVESFPSSARVRVEFQGADPLNPGSLQIDPASRTPFTPDISLLRGKQFFRFRVLLDSNADGADLDPLLPLPGLEFLKTGLEF